MKRIITHSIVICLAGLGCCSAAAGRQLPRTGELVPPETLVMLDIADFNLVCRQFEKTTVYKLWNDPAMAPFVEGVKTKMQQKMERSESPLLKTLTQAGVRPVGRFAAVLVGPGQKQPEAGPAIIVISQWGDGAAKIRQAVDKEVEKTIAAGSHRQSEDYRGASIVTITEDATTTRIPQADENEAPYGGKSSPSTTSYCFLDDCLIVGDNTDVVKFVVARVEGAASAALAADSDYAAATGATGPHHDIDFYVNIKELTKMALSGDPAGEARQMLFDLGLDNVTGLACSIGLARSAGASVEGKAIVRVSGSKRGICRMLDAQSASVSSPRFVPSSAYSVIQLNVDPKKAYDEFQSIMAKFDPESVEEMQQPLVPAGAEGEPPVTLRADVIDYLRSELIIAQNVKKPFAAGLVPTETLFAVAVNNRTALEKSLARIHAAATGSASPETQRDLLGHTIYIIAGGLPLPGMGLKHMQSPSGPVREPPQKMAFTVTDTHLIMGEQPAVENAIRSLAGGQAGASISSAAWWTKARGSIPSGVGMARMDDNAASAEILWWMLKETARTQRLRGAGPAGYFFSATEVNSLADFTLLPSFDSVRKHFGTGVFYGISRPDGFFFEFKTLDSGGS